MFDKRVEFLSHEVDARTAAEKGFQDSVNATVKKTTDNQETLRKRVDTDSTNLVSVVKKHMDTLQQNYMNPTGRELQMRNIDSKFRHELETIQKKESGECTKFQVEIERNFGHELGGIVSCFSRTQGHQQISNRRAYASAGPSFHRGERDVANRKVTECCVTVEDVKSIMICYINL